MVEEGMLVTQGAKHKQSLFVGIKKRTEKENQKEISQCVSNQCISSFCFGNKIKKVYKSKNKK